MLLIWGINDIYIIPTTVASITKNVKYGYYIINIFITRFRESVPEAKLIYLYKTKWAFLFLKCIITLSDINNNICKAIC